MARILQESEDCLMRSSCHGAIGPWNFRDVGRPSKQGRALARPGRGNPEGSGAPLRARIRIDSLPGPAGNATFLPSAGSIQRQQGPLPDLVGESVPRWGQTKRRRFDLDRLLFAFVALARRGFARAALQRGGSNCRGGMWTLPMAPEVASRITTRNSAASASSATCLLKRIPSRSSFS